MESTAEDSVTSTAPSASSNAMKAGKSIWVEVEGVEDEEEEEEGVS